MAGQIWVRVVKKNSIIRSETAPCTWDGWKKALSEVCQQMDIGHPVIMPRHDRDWDTFGLTHFLPEHFLESVAFDRMEVQYIDPDRKKHDHMAEFD